MKVIENKEKFKIKWCPFCGGMGVLKTCSSPYLQDNGEKTMYMRDFYVKCENNFCGALTRTFTSQIFLDKDGTIQITCNGAEKAISAWNKRY